MAQSFRDRWTAEPGVGCLGFHSWTLAEVEQLLGPNR